MHKIDNKFTLVVYKFGGISINWIYIKIRYYFLKIYQFMGQSSSFTHHK